MKFVQIITLSLLISSCRATDRSWWKHATIYEVLLKSFKDSNGDGIGDFKGLISKLDYFGDIGIDALWITPYFPYAMADGGYDITDFYGIDPTYGTMEDFDELMREMKKRGLNFVMDLVINHSSDEHEWFQKSIKKIEPYTDYYVWVNPKGYNQDGKPIPPNNWVSIFDLAHVSSAWTWNDERKQFYFHQFGVKQPDFNLRNKNVKKDLKNSLQYPNLNPTWWRAPENQDIKIIYKGVAAFRVDAVPFFMEDPQLRDEADSDEWPRIFKGLQEGYSNRLHHPDTIPFLHELALYLRQYDRKHKKKLESAMISEGYGHINILKKYFGTSKYPITNFPINFCLTMLQTYLDAQQMIDYLNNGWLKRIPKGAASNWATSLLKLGNHDQGRIFQRFNTEYNSILLAFVTMLPGTSLIYYGEELSQEIFDFEPGKPKDFFFDRDRYRLPMQWDDSLNAGFTSGGNPWVPVKPDYWRCNVELQKKQQNSTLKYFKDLTTIRRTEALKFGDIEFFAISKWILAFARTYRQSKYIIVLNLGTESNLVDLHSSITDLPPYLTVATASPNSGYKKGQQFQTVSIPEHSPILRPHSTVVLNIQ